MQKEFERASMIMQLANNFRLDDLIEIIATWGGPGCIRRNLMKVYFFAAEEAMRFDGETHPDIVDALFIIKEMIESLEDAEDSSKARLAITMR